MFRDVPRYFVMIDQHKNAPFIEIDEIKKDLAGLLKSMLT